MAKIRIHDIAKELDINSKVIIQKCLDEGVPAENVKNHMAVIPAGLVASIREWFAPTAGEAQAGASSTAVETTQHLDVEKLHVHKAKPAARRKSSGTDAGNGDSTGTSTESSTAVAEPKAPAAPIVVPATPAPRPGRTDAPVTPVVPAKPAIVKPAPVISVIKSTPPVQPGAANAAPPAAPRVIPAAAAAAAAASAAAATPTAPDAPVTSTPLPGHGPSATKLTPTGIKPIVTHVTPVPPPPIAKAAVPPAGTEEGNAGSAGATTPTDPTSTPPGNGRPAARAPFRPPVMNVPTRPTHVAPMGQQLGAKTQVKLAGPRVVRIEAPEQVSTPSRRPPSQGGGSSSGPPRGGRGVVTGGGSSAGGDDASARRNKRRAGPADQTAAPRRRPTGPKPEDLPSGTGFSEQDLAEREERLARAAGTLKQRRREAKARAEAKGGLGGGQVIEGRVAIQAPFTIKNLSEAAGVKAADIIKKLFMQGVMATINSGIDPAKAQEIMIDFDLELDVTYAKTAEQKVEAQHTDRKRVDEQSRSPIVTIMGHVDHGKTSLLDAIRKTNVASGEAGGITQKTTAFKVPVVVNGVTKHVVFIDTPGHEAFTEMRARGANVTDVVVLVVGAPEGVMPQTVECIAHARAAKVPIVVALNKIDSPQATENQIQKVYGQLAEHNLSPVQWGGQTEVIHTSATKGTGVPALLEILELQADVLQLKADFKGAARGRVIEASRDEGRGPLSTVMVQEGELNIGDFIVVGCAFGRVRDMTDTLGNRIKVAGPATPVLISGFDQVPDAGDAFFVTATLDQAKDAAHQRRDRDRAEALHQPKVTLDSLFSQMKNASVKEILIVLKADVQGSVDVISNQIEKLSSEEVKVRVLHSAVGGITESDVVLADASKAVIVGFNVISTNKARQLAEQKSVEVRTYQVIYDIVDDVKKAASGLLEPEIRQEVLGHAEVRKVFKVTKVGTIAGCYITDGMVQRDALMRVTRGGIVIEQDRILEQLKRLKDDAKDVKAGMECGMKIVGYDDIKEGDVLECYKKVEIKRTL